MKLARETVVAVVTAFFVGLVHVLSLPAQALTDDDDFYAPAAIRYADWLIELFTSPSTALTTTGIDAGFGLNHEHPPLAKLVAGVAERFARLLPDALSFGVLDGVRLGTVCFVVVLAFVLVRWLYRPLGPVVAVGSVLVLLSLPRFFLHSEVPTLDVPVAVMIVVVTAAFERARDRVGAGFVVGVLFGLATATKLNAPFAVVPLVVVTVLERWRGFGLENIGGDMDGRSGLASLRVPNVPPSLWWMATVGPLVFVLVWPWLWPDLFPRIGAYVAFHLRHYPIYLFYDGEIWEKPFAPGMASVVLGFGSVPLVVVVSAAIGAVKAAAATARLALGSTSARDRVLALVLLQAVVSVAVVAVSDVPRYGGEKLFMPLFPFLAVLAAVGAKDVVDAVVALVARRSRSSLSLAPAAPPSPLTSLSSPPAPPSPPKAGEGGRGGEGAQEASAAPPSLPVARPSLSSPPAPPSPGTGEGGRGGEGPALADSPLPRVPSPNAGPDFGLGSTSPTVPSSIHVASAASTVQPTSTPDSGLGSTSPTAPSPPRPPSPAFGGEGGAYGIAQLRSAVIVGVVFAALLGPGVVGIASTWGGYGLSYYGELVGGLRGAVARGYERTYYDLADKTLARTLDEVARGQRVHVEPNHKEYVRTWRWLRKDGVIDRDGFVIDSSFDSADVVVLMHERRWKTYPALRERVRGWKVLAEKRVDGVPLWTVLRR